LENRCGALEWEKHTVANEDLSVSGGIVVKSGVGDEVGFHLYILSFWDDCKNSV